MNFVKKNDVFQGHSETIKVKVTKLLSENGTHKVYIV